MVAAVDDIIDKAMAKIKRKHEEEEEEEEEEED